MCFSKSGMAIWYEILVQFSLRNGLLSKIRFSGKYEQDLILVVILSSRRLASHAYARSPFRPYATIHFSYSTFTVSLAALTNFPVVGLTTVLNGLPP